MQHSFVKCLDNDELQQCLHFDTFERKQWGQADSWEAEKKIRASEQGVWGQKNIAFFKHG